LPGMVRMPRRGEGLQWPPREGECAGMVAEWANGVDPHQQQLGECPIELGEGLCDGADGEGGVGAAKSCPGFICVVVRNVDCTGEIVFSAALLRRFPRWGHD
jgi:hypothetical protein